MNKPGFDRRRKFWIALGFAVVLTTLAIGQTRSPTPGQELLRQFAGSDDTDAFLRHELVRPQLVQLLGDELPHFERNLDVRGSVDLIGGMMSISGNAVHQGTEEEAVLCVSWYNLDMTAAIFSNGIVTAYSKGGTYDSLPLCIKDWITQVNSEHKDRFLQPPNVRMAPGR